MRRLLRLTRTYWQRRHGADTDTAKELADLSWWHFTATDGDILRTWDAELEDRANPEPW